ncbi:hypothetical protein ACNKHK_10320 [Shigella flexneri]
MCKAMNRSFFSVIAGGFGSDGSSTGCEKSVSTVRLLRKTQQKC